MNVAKRGKISMTCCDKVDANALQTDIFPAAALLCMCYVRSGIYNKLRNDHRS